MKIIDAFWEKRNLGVDTVEMEIEENDDVALLETEINKNEKAYNVIKVPAGNMEINYLLGKLGYIYNETLFNLTHDLKLTAVNPIQKRMSDCVSCAIMNEDDIDELYTEIGKGMFTTDRIALNPDFGIETASKRYINWISDELSRGTKLYKMVYKNESIGFFTFKEIEKGVYYPFLAGMYEKYLNSGFGINIVIKPIEVAASLDGKCNSTYVSSNNQSALSTHLAIGFRVKKMTNVFTKLVK